jgi:AcrR family transcriptional regulator
MVGALQRPRVPSAQRRKQLLRIAAKLFAKQGFGNTTTRQLADAAGVKESIVFRFFETKEDLYWQVLDHQIKLHGDRSWFQAALQSGGSDRQILLTIAIESLRRDKSLARMLLFTQLDNRRFAGKFIHAHLEPLHNAMSDFVAKRVRDGRFRKIDPLLATYFFIGGLAHYFQILVLLSGKPVDEIDAETVADAFVDIWLQGMLSQK